jgi:DNA-binding HxlR family transcriptional regulator
MSLQERSDRERTGRLSDVDTVPLGRTDEILVSIQELLGRKWHPIVLYHLLWDGPQGFSGLKGSISDVSSKMLSESLSELEELGLVERTIINEKPVRVEYELTRAGRDLEPVLVGMIRWGRKHLDGPSGFPSL